MYVTIVFKININFCFIYLFEMKMKRKNVCKWYRSENVSNTRKFQKYELKNTETNKIMLWKRYKINQDVSDYQVMPTKSSNHKFPFIKLAQLQLTESDVITKYRKSGKKSLNKLK